MAKDLKVGFYGEYIDDLRTEGFNVQRIVEIPQRPAVIWIQQEINSELKPQNRPYYNQFYGNLHGWCNKGYYIVGENRDGYIALYNHDGNFYIYKIEEI